MDDGDAELTQLQSTTNELIPAFQTKASCFCNDVSDEWYNL